MIIINGVILGVFDLKVGSIKSASSSIKSKNSITDKSKKEQGKRGVKRVWNCCHTSIMTSMHVIPFQALANHSSLVPKSYLNAATHTNIDYVQCATITRVQHVINKENVC